MLFLWLVGSPAQAQTTNAPSINLSLHKKISNQSPAVGSTVTYTLVVTNAPGSTTATGIKVQDNLPVEGVAFIPASVSVIRGNATFASSGSTTATVGVWSIPAIAPNDSVIVTLSATVLERGVWFDTAEITAADQTDSNSTPNNQVMTEDDYDAVCFSVPVLWYAGDEYTVTVPSGYDQIVWYREVNGASTIISTPAVSTSLAQVNSDQSLTIKSPGTYRFVTYRNGCPSSNCCDIQLIQGPYGSLGDFVFVDTDRNGAQGTGEPGINGVKVILYAQNSTGTNTKIDSTITANGGKYLFDSLTDGNYVVQFIAPTGYQSTSVNAAGVLDSLNSDAGVNGFTRVYTIDTSQPTSSTARNNPTVDAGYYLPTASLGDYVFVDANKNGIQDTGDSPLAGVTVVLLGANNTPISSTTTNATGMYSFTGLTPGIPYSVSFVAPTGFVSTSAQIGGDDTKDSDANPVTGQTRSVTLAPGENNLNLDAGFYLPTATLGDYVFNDVNQNGIQDAGDTPLAGVVVVLLGANNTPITSYTTTATGMYSFTGLTPGVPYSVSFVAPTGFVSTSAQLGGDDTKDSDVNPVTGQTRSVTLAPGENNLNLDAGFYLPTASLGDYVFVDANKNGIQDTGDAPLAGVTVVLLGANNTPIRSMTTNATGMYSFTGLTPGIPYSVSFVAPTGFVSTSAQVGGDDTKDSDANPVTGQTRSVTLAPGEKNLNLDAGFYLPTATLGDYVFNDVNQNGIQDTGDTPLAGVVVVLLGANNTPITSYTTTASGAYSFTGLTPGVPYSVSFVAPTSFVSTSAQIGGDDTKDSDVNPVTGQTRSVTLAPGENNLNLDAGFYLPTASLGDYTFVDANKNGIQDTGDSPLAGVTVVLLGANNTPIRSMTTSTTGFYSFTGLTPGVPYSVSFVAPTGFVSTSAQIGGNDAKDSDANPVTGQTRSVTLAPGENNPNLDAGFYLPTATLGDYVFNDVNQNGIQDAGDTPLAGVVVVLLGANNTPITSVTTTATGLYSFTGLTPGVPYSVSFVAPTGYLSTSAQIGGDDTKDSDVNPVTGQTRSVTLTPGQNNLNLDAGFYLPTASLGDYTFVDANKNGIQDTGDSPLAGVTVVLLGANNTPIRSMTTTSTGFYSFTGLTPGVPYSVSFVAPTGFVSTSAQIGGNDAKDSDANPVTGQTRSVTLAPGENNPNLDAGFYLPTATLGDYVFNDVNQNGIQDAGDTPLAGVVVVLLGANNTPITSYTTNATGMYSFTGLTPGVPYSVSFVAPTGFVSTSAQLGGDDTKDSDVNPVTGQTRSVTLAPGQNNLNLDAGFYLPTASLGDYTFVDANKNGIQDTGDSPLAGVMVVLLGANNTPIRSMTTSTTGFYSFTGLTPGVPYSVSFVAPTGFVSTSAQIGGNDAKDSDANPVTGQTRSVTLAPGENNPNLDAGFYLPTASLGDYVFNDVNKNGIQDTGDTPLVGVVVVLLGANNTPITSYTTTASGAYSFTGLTPGVPYSVSFVAPTGFVSTSAQIGGDDTKDSDVNPVTGQTRSVTLAPGENNLNLDAGFYLPTASLGDYTFVDANKNGIQDAGDSPLAGVTVVLLGANNTPISSTTSTATGFYSFTGLTPGVPYSVSFVAPTGYVSTSAQIGGDDTKDSDVNPVTGQTRSVTLAPGQNNPNLDAGFYLLTATLGEYVFLDANEDGIQDAGDTPLAGVVVVLLDANNTPIASVTTTSTGFYSFTGLTPGVPYSVSFVAPTGYVSTSALMGGNDLLDSDANPLTGKTRSVTLSPGQNYNTLDAGFFIPRASLGDYTFVDANKNGIQDVGDSPLAGVTVVLLNGNNTPVASMTTSTTGFYSFTGLTPGVPYSVSFVAPTGFVSTSAQIGGDDTKDSDANPVTGQTRSVTLAPGQNNPNLDAGFYLPTASLGDYVFNDVNKNGIQDASDTPLAGVVVVLLGANNTPITSVTTTATGLYSFTGLTPGVPYSVSFVAPTGYLSTSAQIGGDDTKDSDVNPVTGQTRSVTLTPGQNNLNLDAGFYLPTASLGDYTFVDANKNGIQDAGDSPLAGVTVVLLNGANTPVASMTTTSTGFYSFTGLTPGVPYSVSFVTPTGYLSTSAQVGGNDAKDSDADPITGKTRSVTLAPNENNPNLDAGFYPACPTNFSLVASNDQSICNGDVATITATSSVTASQIRWYLAAVDGVAFATTTNGASLTVNPTTTTTYYAEAFTADGCVSPRKPVSVSVTTVATPIALGTIKNNCPDRTVDLTKIQVDNRSTGLVYEWYMSINRSIATQVTNLTAVGAGKYYLFAKLGNCYSNPTVLTVDIVDCNCQNPASVTATAIAAVCSGDMIPLQATIGGSATAVTWSTTTGGSFSATSSLTTSFTPSAADIAAGSVQITVTTNDPDGICPAATYTLLVKINKRPDAPLGVACDDTLVCQGSSTKLVGFAPNGKINWYNAAGALIGTTVSGGKLVITPTLAGANVYYAEAVSAEGCVSSTRSSLTVTVGTCLADLAVVKQIVTPGPYSLGQTVTYAITVNNNGPIKANNVTVSDVLPASLTYVSSTPTGQYNAGTGIWTIGALNAGSDRNLMIEATIVGTGSIKNTAKVNSPDNDPKYALNDTSSVTIPVNQCNVQPPVLVCAITEVCKGGTTILSAKGCDGGTVKWSDGKTGMTIFETPNMTTTYSASCIVGTCVSAASAPITVTVNDPQAPTITASADNVCPGSSVTLTAGGCANGTIEWSDKAQTGTSIVVMPYSKTTYTAQCRMGSCLSIPATKTINISSDIPAPTVTCSTTVVCPGETVTLTVENCVGTPVWNSTTATTGSIVVTPTLGSNSYSVYCKNGACISKSSPVYTINIVSPVIPTVRASADTICAGGMVTLTASDCNGTVVWNVEGKTGPSITVSPTANISYFAQCRYRTCLSSPSNTVNIAVVIPTAPIVKVSKTLICSGDPISLTATGCNGTVQWHGVDKVGASITIYPTQTAEYYATCKQGVCESDASNRVRVTVNTSPTPAPTVTASTLATCGGGVVSLSATGCNGTIKWSDGQTGAIVSVTATTTNHDFYALCLPSSSTACGSGKSNVISINVTPTPTPTIERCLCSADTICPGEHVKFTVRNCQGTPYWSTGETTTSIIVSPTVTTGYSVYCQDGVCKSAATGTYTITVIPVAAPTITASATTVAPGGTVTLSATGCNGTVIWSAADVNGNNQGASIVVRPEGTQTYYAQCKFRECLSDPSVTIVINPGDCVAKAGSLAAVNGTVCGSASTTVTLAATLNGGLVQPNGYSVLYVLTQGTSKVVLQTSTTPQFSVSAASGLYTIHTLVYNANATDKNYIDLSVVKPGITTASDVLALIGNKCAALDVTGAPINVNTIAPPVLSAGPSLTVCSSGTTSLSATGCVGGTITWSDGTIGATYTKAVYSNQTLTAICTVNGCASAPSAPVQIVMGSPAVPIIVSNSPSVCLGEVVSLTATGCDGGTYLWSDGKTGNVITVTPNADISYRVKCKIGTCEGDWSAYTTIKVGAPNAPTISIAGTISNTVCFGAPITLTAQGCGPDSYVTWSNNQVGNTITVSPAVSTTFTARCCTSNQCKSAPSNLIAVTVLSKVAQPVVKDLTNTCPMMTVDLAKAISTSASTSGGQFEYYSDAALSAKVADPAHVLTGTYYVIERTVNGCVSLPVMIHVQITTCNETTPCDATNPATANAGADASVCAAKTYQLNGSIGGAGKTAHWTTSGSGSFDNSYALNAVYTASAEDIMSGKVTLTLSVSTNNAACPVATDAMLLSIEGVKSIPTVTVAGGLNLCYGDSVTLKAPAGAAGYLWSNGQTTQNILVKTGGTYNVQLMDGKGCSSVKSDNVTIQVNQPVMTPLVHDLRNSCPAKIADLTKALSMTNAGSTYTYRICECNTSNIVIRPDSVCAGTYWVVEKNANGCVSAPAKIVVNVINCAADTMNADVSISKLASTAIVQNGAPVTYTLTVSNAGPHTARHIQVRDVLPQGLELVPNTGASYNISNGVLTQRIDSLPVGQSKQIVYLAKITKGQTVVNTAEIVYLDNKDANLANNTASVTVRDSTTRRPSVVGLAKAVTGTPMAIGDSLIRVSYRFVVSNYGEDTLRKVQVADDLAYSFSPNKVMEAKVTLSNPRSSLVISPSFNGTGANTLMIDSTSYLAPNHSETFDLQVTVKRTAGDTTRSFKNYGVVSAHNSLTTVTDISTNGGDPDPDGDGNPTNNTSAASFTLGASQPQGASIGLALAVVKVESTPDSAYNVTYKATIKNFGTVDLKGVVLTDSLIRAFVSPTSYTIVSGPTVGAGSTLVANAGFDGNGQSNLLTNASMLAAGMQDTVLVTVKVKTNGNNGPFYSSATVVGHTPDSTQTVMDISNNGFDPAPAGSTSTTVRFDLPKGLLGVAKSVGNPTMVDDGVYDIPYTIALVNLGTVPLKNVQVEDKLSETFGHGALIVSNQIAITGTGVNTLKIDPTYSGQGMVTKMLVDSMSTLAVGGKAYLNFTVRVNVKNADSLVFYNTAMATAMTPDNEIVQDASTAGTNDDPDNDLDPRNNSQPTPIALNGLSTSSYLGLAMSVRDTTRQSDGSYNVTYQIVAKAYGPDALKNVSITDSLAQVFNSQTGSTYSVVNMPVIISTGSALKLNPNYNGGSDPVLVLNDSTSRLAAGKADTILVVVNVASNGSTTTFLNSAYGQAVAKSGRVSDISTSGLNPDLNGNGNPTDSNEREATALSLPPTYQTIFIPEGFSPNGDGVNDLFVIRGTAGLTVSLEVYNRWGHVVYQNSNYKNDWDGKPNTGIVAGSDTYGVPDGTYYYVINLSDGRKFVRYMTINR